MTNAVGRPIAPLVLSLEERALFRTTGPALSY